MERREFLVRSAVGLFAASAVTRRASAGEFDGLLLADAHAHPIAIEGRRSYDPSTPSPAMMRRGGLALSAFAAIGDLAFHPRRGGTPFADTRQQLAQALRLEAGGEVRFVRSGAEVAALRPGQAVMGGLLAIEGGDALEGRIENLDAFHADGVRMLTLVHDRDNEIGGNQRSSADGPLTSFGRQVIERMNERGMLIDVAHAKGQTLRGIVEASAVPLVDSHTSLLVEGEDGSGLRRLRTWSEMELVARGGGLVCTWPFAYRGNRSQRTTLREWAAEVVRMKSRLGIEHCALGTDGGGGLPRMVDGWSSIDSLPALLAELRAAGLSTDDVAAFAGGNFLRVLSRSLGTRSET